jgi:hypothetical protein
LWAQREDEETGGGRGLEEEEINGGEKEIGGGKEEPTCLPKREGEVGERLRLGGERMIHGVHSYKELNFKEFV